MQITSDAVVSIHYTLTNDSGETLDSSAGGEPLAYLHGRGNLIPGLENALAGKQAGDKLQVKVPPGEGYGEYDKALLQSVPRRSFKGVGNVQVGMQFQVQSPQGPRAVTVTRVAGDMVTVDGNHPLAGKNLTFDIEITDVRSAREEELAHGHVHGPGGHHHHE
jgi:FKBP-type peptidyl-prolyl cis-trans isomerase SlyD